MRLVNGKVRRRKKLHWLELIAIVLGVVTVAALIGFAIIVFSGGSSPHAPELPQPYADDISYSDSDVLENHYDDSGYSPTNEDNFEQESNEEEISDFNDTDIPNAEILDEVEYSSETDDANEIADGIELDPIIEAGTNGEPNSDIGPDIGQILSEEIHDGILHTVSENVLSSRRFIVAIDPGHQGRGNYQREPNGPGSATYKAKVASGTRGVSSGVPEFQLVLDVSLLLRDELIERGFDVFMIRETNDVNISNRERAIMATAANADIFVRVHANGSANSDANGILTITHSRNNPYIPELADLSHSLSEHMLASMVDATGARNLGVLVMDNMTGSNWSTVPVTIVEMGFMTNAREDELMQTPEYQEKLVNGMANGIVAYFNEHFS